METHRRHDISDRVWNLLEPHLPGRKGTWGGIARDNRTFINAVFWILRTGAPWRDLPPDYGGWSNTHRRFIRWRNQRVWERLLEIVIDDPDYEWLVIDASHYACLQWVSGTQMSNSSLRKRLGIKDSNYPMASRILKDSIDDGLIKPYGEQNSKKAAKYIPFWA